MRGTVNTNHGGSNPLDTLLNVRKQVQPLTGTVAIQDQVGRFLAPPREASAEPASYYGPRQYSYLI